MDMKEVEIEDEEEEELDPHREISHEMNGRKMD